MEVGKAAVGTAVDIIKKQPYIKEIQLNFQLVDQNNVQFDPGWGGTYQPSFSAFAFPQQLGVLGASGK